MGPGAGEFLNVFRRSNVNCLPSGVFSSGILRAPRPAGQAVGSAKVAELVDALDLGSSG